MRPLSPTFNIGIIRFGTIEGASCVNFGNNFPSHFSSLKKQNQGFGSISGDNNDIHDILSRLEEKDIIEAIHQSQSEEDAEWITKILTAGNESELVVSSDPNDDEYGEEYDHEQD